MDIIYFQLANDVSCAVAGEIYDPFNHICNCGRENSCVKVQGMVNKYPSSFNLFYFFDYHLCVFLSDKMFCILLKNVLMTHIAQKWGPKCMLSAEMESAKVTLLSKVMILKYINFKK